ncbi:hypothetical protein PsalMR5_04556 (plasmid) [Piscirickettsia salmonis]|nr:hypothetical protein PsalSR1_04454 [Piscirickettsia salmonis]QGP61755.1 hypothetical protein PsalBI1_04397 [Piscirickettsia salmonis]QGP66631.1 hypothetical protein PsalMR5_04556 [Piscirickettsia salmonis]
MKQNWTEVKKQLKYCSERDLMGIIQDLYKLNKNNKDYLHLRYNSLLVLTAPIT